MKGPGVWPGPLKSARSALLGDFAERGEALLHRLRRRGGGLLRQFGEFLRLRGEALELRAHIRRALLDDFRIRLRGQQFAVEIEGSVGVGARIVDQLEA